MASKKRAEVVGAGIAGLTAAIALARRGWAVRLHERDREIRAIGAGIYLWGNGLSVLETLGLYQEAVVGAHVGPVLESRDHRNRTVEAVRINGPGQPRVYTITRERLIDTLLRGADAAGVEIHTGSEVTEVDPDGTVHSPGGRAERADLVVAADGVNSKIRDRFALVRRRVRLKQGASRLTVAMSDGFVPAEDRGKYIEYFSGRRRVLYTPSSATSLYVALVADEDDAPAGRIPVDPDAWAADFPELATLLRALADVPARWDTFEFLTLRRWSVGRIAFVGDAAHAQPPYLGQGGGCAMMNALGLVNSLGDVPRSVEPLLPAWEAAQRPTIEHTQRWAYRLRLVNPMPNPVRAPLLRLAGRIPALGRSRLRAAMTVPTSSPAGPVRGSDPR
ncbi:FAD-dependent oxidoreductase [Pseudonocardia acaciae]|uniref:FAD-dependent oxidoreductase n=1 Tax=Pseudonocardia acaciae TaxID=551276 RepID=UPI0005646F3B|nr:NAD(P)/FAD-dependent oxidoreductase [Pseudonocardia acaciae]